MGGAWEGEDEEIVCGVRSTSCTGDGDVVEDGDALRMIEERWEWYGNEAGDG